MGLNMSHNCFDGAYSSFRRLRADVAKAWPQHAEIKWESYPARCYLGWWDEDHPYKDALEVFFVHSDCEGYIFPGDLDPLIRRLDQIKGDVSDEREPGYWSPRARLQQFIDGLRTALDEWEIVRFR